MPIVVKNPRSKIHEICQELGNLYEIRVIDLENVIYRDLGNGFDFEISGLDNQSSTIKAMVYVWQQKPKEIIEKLPVRSLDELKTVLSAAVNKYLVLEAPITGNLDRFQDKH